MSLIDYEGFDIATTGSFYTIGKGWDGTNSLPGTASTVASRNAVGNGMPLTASNSRMTRFLTPGEEDDVLIIGVAYKPTALYTSSGQTNAILTLASEYATWTHVLLGHDNLGKIHVKRGGTGGTLLGQEAGNTFATLNVYHYVEMYVRLDDVNGSVEVRVDGNTTPVISLTGVDTRNSGSKTTFDTVTLRGNYTTGNGGAGHFDDFYMCNGLGASDNTFMGDIVVQTLAPNADGTYNQLVGSDGNSTANYALIDEAPPSIADYVASATDDQQDTYNFANLSGSPTSIRAVRLLAYAAKSDAGPKSLAFVTRSGGVDAAGADIPLSTSWAYYGDIMTEDPTDAAEWTQIKVDAAEFGVKVRP